MQPGRRLTAGLPALFGAVALALLCAPPAEARTAHKAPHKAPHKAEEAAPPVSALKPLSAKDARLYADAFAAVRAGRFAEADAVVRKTANPLLSGRVEYAKLMHPDYAATYDELADWLERYRDQADADRVYTLARKRRPGATPAAPEAAPADEPIWSRVEALAQRVEASAPPIAPQAALTGPPPAAPVQASDRQLQAARETFYGGDLERGYDLAVKAGERWVAALAAFRLKRFEEARSRFAVLAVDQTQNEWVRSGAGYWAARAAVAAGSPEAAPDYLTLAARTPYTFYGLIAERQLGLDPAVGAQGLDSQGLDPATAPSPVPRAPTLGLGGPAVAKLIKADRRARRAAAYAQLGMRNESAAELRAGLMGAPGAARQDWIRLGLTLNAPLTSPADLTCAGRATRFDLAQFPTPELTPQGGFTLDKALVYALVRQESRFDAAASSASGAWGLMQLMPATAAHVVGDDKLRADPRPLRDPAFNLRVGQDYVAGLLSALNGDLLHAVAAYNAGPGVIQKTLKRLGKNADPLLAIESMPGAQTREYVERVVAGYWIYRSIFGQDSPTLDAVASGRRTVAVAMDPPVNTAVSAKLAPDLVGGFFAQAE